MSLKRFNGFYIVTRGNKEYYFMNIKNAFGFIAKRGGFKK